MFDWIKSLFGGGVTNTEANVGGVQERHDAIRAHLHYEQSLRDLYDEALYVRPKFYEDAAAGTMFSVAGWAHLSGEPAIVPCDVDLLMIVDSSDGALPRQPAEVLRILEPYTTRHSQPCVHLAISVPEAERGALLAQIQQLPDHQPEPGAITQSQFVPPVQDGSSIQRSLDELSKQGEDARIMPLLKPSDWGPRAIAAHDLFQQIDKPLIPVVAYCRDTVENFVFLTLEDTETLPMDEIRAQAQANIDAIDVAWEVFDTQMLTGSGNEFSAEKILCKDFLLEAQSLLKAERILIGVPRRSIIYAADADGPAEALDQFRKVFRYTFHDDSFDNAPITNLLFRFADGDLIGAELIE